jgi:hypothetical protein
MDDLAAVEAAIYDQSFRALDEQARVLEGLRARAGALVAGASRHHHFRRIAGRSLTTTAAMSTRTHVNCAGCSERSSWLASVLPWSSFCGSGSSSDDQDQDQEEVEAEAELARPTEAVHTGHRFRGNRPADPPLERADPLDEQLDERRRVDADCDLRIRRAAAATPDVDDGAPAAEL